VSLARIINVPPRGIGQKTLDDLEGWARHVGMTPPQALQLLADVGEEAPFNARARNALLAFADQLKGWQDVKDELSPADLLTAVLKDTGYLAYLDDGTDEGRSRAENVLELITVAQGYEGLSLTTFLEEVSLVSDVDTLGDESPAPSLLTLHSAKGLEFPVVFIVGLEENILPHARSIGPERNPAASPEEKDEARRAVEEERRLLYVGITRAEQRLYLVFASIRSLYGDSRANLPSRFLYDIPESAREGSPLSRRVQADLDRESFQALIRWDRGASVGDRPREKAARPAPAARFKGGDLVWHARYGEGVVISAQASGEMEQVDVLFPGGVGQKTIVADFLKPMDT